MPPKTNSGASKKVEQKKKEKVIEDKTFGLKNKKGAKNQKFIQQVQHQVKSGGNPVLKKAEDIRKAELAKKDDKKKEQLELNDLFKPVAVQKIEKGADPKSVLCAFFKQGQCGKGNKCKFSHDLTIERKTEKRSFYCDMRDEDLMENWDDEKLKEVIEKKHAEDDSKHPKTEIICKFFLDALEKSKYGWFWECPNGGACIYRHALPPGFVLNKDKKKDDKKVEISIEDLVEKERANLGGVLTKITLTTFMAWKKKKIKDKIDTAIKEENRKKADFKSGKNLGLSGREMFTFRPEMATEDDTEEGEATYDTSNLRSESDLDSVAAREIDLDALAFQAQEIDGTGTIAEEVSQRLKHVQLTGDSGLDEAAGGEGASAVNGAVSLDGDIAIDEDLFDAENLSDLEGLSDENSDDEDK